MTMTKKFDKQIISQIVLVVLFFLACYWIAAQPNPFEVAEVPPLPSNGQVAPPSPTELALKATEYQLEIEGNRDQTIGIVFGGIVLVVLVIGGTLLVMDKQ
jgi:hypothetical protein